MQTKRRFRNSDVLAGQTVLVTRPRGQVAALSSRLRALGARVLEIPTIHIADPPDLTPLLRAAERLAEYDWVVFTSANGVRTFRRAMEAVGASNRLLEETHVAAIGPATGQELRACGVRSTVLPDAYRAERLVRAIGERARVIASDGGQPLAGARVLLPRAAEARDVLPDGLRAAGASVDVVTAYVTRTDPTGAEELRRVVASGDVNWITFTSSSTVRSFVTLVGPDTGGAKVAVIGPITAETAGTLGVRVDVVASEYTVPGLVRTLVDTIRSDAGGHK